MQRYECVPERVARSVRRSLLATPEALIESGIERKLRRRRFTEDGNIEIGNRDLLNYRWTTGERLKSVESECGAVAVGRAYLLPPLSSGGASLVRPWLRFHTPLIEPDVQISRIRLSDKTSRLFRV